MRDMLKMFGLLGAGIAICMAMDAPVWAQDQAVTLTDDASIDKVIAAMTQEEKAKLIAGVGMANPELRINGAAGGTYPIPRLGIPQVVVTDGPAGIRLGGVIGGETEYATAFPIPSALSATWDVEQIKAVAAAMGAEAKAFGIDMLLGPALNIHRDPLNGRNFEYYAEDPYLAGKITTAFVEGIQSQGVGATLKHYAANNQETDRQSINEIISERALREIYLPAFEMAVKEAKPWSVMSSYPKINGEHGAQNPYLLTDILRKEWGFDGFVMSDWFAVKDPVVALPAGNDLIMPGGALGNAPSPDQIVLDAVKAGQLSEEALNENVRRILKIVVKTPVFQGEKAANALDAAAHAALARATAADGMVLLKNDGTLPLQNVKTMAVIGKNAKQFIVGGGGSAQVNADPQKIVSLFDGLKSAGFSLVEAEEGLSGDDAAKLAQASDVAIISIGRGSSEGFDRYSMAMHPEETAMIRTVADAYHAAGKKVVVLLNIGAPVEMTAWNDAADAILLTWQPGQDASAVADVLSGKVNPSGKLPETFPKYYAQSPSYGNFPGYNGAVMYGEGIYVGYRYYDTKGIEPMYPFGHGLSYTTFSYSNLKLSAPQMDLDKDETLTVSVDVTNSGSVAGKEVAQLYIHDNASRLDRPYQELKGFQKIALNPGETKTVTFTVDQRALSAYDPAIKDWNAEAGRFTARVGSSSRDITVEAEFKAVGNAANAINLKTPWMTVETYQAAATIVAKYIGDDAVHFWKPGPAQTFEEKLNETYSAMPELKDDPQKQQEITQKILAEIADL